MARRLLIATTNPGKAREIAGLFAGLPVRCVHLGELDPDKTIEEAQEDGCTFEENARIKAIYYGKLTRIATVAEDAGLVIPALGGWPGVYSSRVAGSDSERVSLALNRMERLVGVEREARFVSVSAFYDPEMDEIVTFEGVVQGVILKEPCGENGFGYDPIFWHPGYGKTLAELTTDEKNMISHRGQSFRALCRWLKWSGWPADEST